MNLDDNVVRCMALGRVFKDHEDRVNSLDFHRTEDLMVTAGEDDAVHLYNTITGQRTKTIFSKKYGVCHVCFSHHQTAIIYASNKSQDHAVRYLSLHDNRYIRYFKGHNKQVTSLCISPRNDLFLSTAMDRQVRLWDLRTNVCQGVMNVPGPPTASFDQQGLVFCVGVESGIIKLYDARNYEKGPFDTFIVSEERNNPANFASVKFSIDGKLMLGVMEGRIYVLDAYSGRVVHKFSSGVPEGGVALEASFSPNGLYVTSGCEDKCIRTWNCVTGMEVAKFAGHAGVPAAVKWAPRRILVASSCTATGLWIPDLAQLQPQGSIPMQQRAVP